MKQKLGKNTLIVVAMAVVLTPVVFKTADADTKVEVRGSVGLRLPNGAVSISVGNTRYHYHRGFFYKKGRNGYVVVNPPRGAMIRELPRGHVRVVVAGNIYYRYRGAYYRRHSQGYIVVEAPIPVREKTSVAVESADSLINYQSVWMGDREFLFRDGQFFQKTSDGLVCVEAPLGAITPEIPIDAVSVWYEDIEYFDADGDYFCKTAEGYKVIGKPWGDRTLIE